MAGNTEKVETMPNKAWEDTVIRCPFVVEANTQFQDGSYGLELKPIISETEKPNLWPKASDRSGGKFILNTTNASIAGAFTPGMVFNLELTPNAKLTHQQFERVDTREALEAGIIS